MNYIEMIGPPGIGKSTLLELLSDSRTKDASWKRYEEAIFDIAASLKWSQLKTPKSKLLYLINKSNISHYKKLGICNTIVNDVKRTFPNKVLTNYNFLVDAQLKAVQHIALNISPINKCSFINWHLQSLQKVFTLEAFHYEPTVIFEEGPLKTHFGLEQININHIEADSLPKAVIYCSLSIEDNLKRIQARKRTTGKLSAIHNELNKENLEQLVAYTHDVAASNYAFIRSIGIPTIEVDLSHPLTPSGIQQLNNFVTTYSDINRNMMVNTFSDLARA